jgi:hypothetical protein
MGLLQGGAALRHGISIEMMRAMSVGEPVPTRVIGAPKKK